MQTLEVSILVIVIMLLDLNLQAAKEEDAQHGKSLHGRHLLALD